jgi:hypothetical protein
MAYNTIKLKKYTDIIIEFTAAASIVPGNLLEITSAGTVQPHSGAGKTAAALFALEDELQGKGIGIASPYVTGDVVQVWHATPGEVVYARQSDEEALIIGDFVESNGYGQLRKVVRSAESWRSADSQAAHVLYDKHIVGVVIVASSTVSLSTDESEARPTEQYVQVRII